MNVQHEFFYFGKIPSEYLGEEETLPGWEPGYYYRIRIDTDIEELKFEDTCGRMIPIDWASIYDLECALTKIEKELVSSILGTPNPNN